MYIHLLLLYNFDYKLLYLEQFLGVSLAAEKEMVLIVIKREDKNRIMRAIMDQAGTASKARSVILSLPVTSTAGLRLLEDEEPEAGIEE